MARRAPSHRSSARPPRGGRALFAERGSAVTSGCRRLPRTGRWAGRRRTAPAAAGPAASASRPRSRRPGGGAGLGDELLEARALQAAEGAVRARPGRGSRPPAWRRSARAAPRWTAAAPARPPPGRGERRQARPRRASVSDMPSENALLEGRRHLVGLAAEGDEARLVGDRAVPGDAVDLVAVRLRADLGDHDLHLVRLAAGSLKFVPSGWAYQFARPRAVTSPRSNW